MKTNLLTYSIKVCIVILIIVYCVIQGYKGGDFRIYLGAAELLKEGKNCYNVWIHLGGDNYCGYSYSPIFAILLIPFTFLPHPSVQILWLFANIFFLYRLFKIMSWYFPLSHFTKKQYRWWVILSVIMILRFVLHNFEMVQVTIFLLYCCLEAEYQIRHNKHWLSGLLVSIGVVVKILPIIMLPYFIYRKQFKSAIFSVLGIVLFSAVPVMIYGLEFSNTLFHDWLNVINFNNPDFSMQQNKHGEGIHSLSGFIAAYFTDINKSDISLRRTIVSLKGDNFYLLLNGSKLLLIGLSIYFLKFPPFIRSKTKMFTMWELAYIFCITPLVFPHQQKYAFFFMAPATMYITYFLVLSYNKTIFSKITYQIICLLMIVYFVLTTLTSDGVIGNHLNDIAEYYKTITIGAFLLLGILVICNPNRLKTKTPDN